MHNILEDHAKDIDMTIAVSYYSHVFGQLNCNTFLIGVGGYDSLAAYTEE